MYAIRNYFIKMIVFVQSHKIKYLLIIQYINLPILSPYLMLTIYRLYQKKVVESLIVLG